VSVVSLEIERDDVRSPGLSFATILVTRFLKLFFSLFDHS
jgi:hypothetical protein